VATKEEVTKFLEAFKGCVAKDGYYVVKTSKNQAGLVALGITKRHRREVILSLTWENYSDGPSPDVAYAGEPLWIFGATVDGVEVYIKLKFSLDGISTCISFHPAERPMSYPLRESEEGRR
jgi:hypothetical protein